MRNVIILGSGRSGTSMVAGTLAKCDYYMGKNLLPANQSNPKGFFEDVEVNGINEAILEQVDPRRPPILGKWFFRQRPLPWQRWLARVPVGTNIMSSRSINERIQKVTKSEPYAFKDPRFSYTLPVWRPFVSNTVFLCVFRSPATTAQSIVKECRTDVRLHTLSINFRRALEIWLLMYKHIIEIHRHQGDWLFLHYDQVLTDEGLRRIEDLTEAMVDHSFPEISLRRTVSNSPVPKDIQNIYDELCELSGYDDFLGRS